MVFVVCTFGFINVSIGSVSVKFWPSLDFSCDSSGVISSSWERWKALHTVQGVCFVSFQHPIRSFSPRPTREMTPKEVSSANFDGALGAEGSMLV